MNRTPLTLTKASYFRLTCNACDRIIYTDELTEQEYNDNGGYCPECRKECECANYSN